MDRIAVIGSGIAGMACASSLHRHKQITVFEREDWIGGHANTVTLHHEGEDVAVDTGFMVYNEPTYPLLTQLFKDLNVPVMNTDMSFGVQHVPDGIAYCGSNFDTLFAQRKNLLSPGFWAMLRDVVRFNKDSHHLLETTMDHSLDLHEFVARNGYGSRFLEHYLLPMTSAIWSTPPDEMLRFPAAALLRFMKNHGLLGVGTHLQWKTVRGGSKEYRDRLIQPFKDKIVRNHPIKAVTQSDRSVQITDAADKVHYFDKVVIATHADEAVQLLTNPTPDQWRLLNAFSYSDNSVLLHTDASVMPGNRKAWASWNYRMDRTDNGSIQSSTHYWMNRLQDVSRKTNFFVSVNGDALIEPAHILRKYSYKHPMFDAAAIQAQAELPQLNQSGNVFFCGSYFRYGFHEDALMSGLQTAESLLQKPTCNAILPI